MSLLQRPRRNRKNKTLRAWRDDVHLSPKDLVYPIFIVDGKNKKQEIKSMPGQNRLSIDLLLKQCENTLKVGVEAVAFFPAIEDSLKNKKASEALNSKGLLCRAVKEVKKRFPELIVITDVALDPYSSDGHDGLVKDGIILNDESVDLMAKVALLHAEMGADIISASDMMDGRVQKIRETLDAKNMISTAILSYTAKYASSFYGPFREALDSAPKSGDKKTYQMSPKSKKEALLECLLDENEGADILMVKPALAYLDIIHILKEQSLLPIAAYNVSGEYSMLKAAAQKGWIDEEKAIGEILISMKRAGADLIFTYFALDKFTL
jgi:porphobilinogen synthase